MSRVLRPFAIFSLIAAAIVVTAAPLLAQNKSEPPPPIAGKWSGTAKGESNEMKIQVTVTEEKGKLTGMVTTAHGEWAIVSVTPKDKTWTIEFSRGEGLGTGSMTGTIAGNTFAGDWNNAPMAVGTFSLARK